MRCFDRRGNSTGKKLVRLNWEKAVYQPPVFFFDNSIWVQLWKNLLPNQLCLFWMWNNMLVHFLRSISSQPPHVAHDHQKWLHMDLIHLFKMLVDFFLAAFHNFLRMFLQTCQMSNWWLILGCSSLISFFICTCLSVVICFILISLASMPCKTFWKPYFSILFEFPHSVNYITDIATILLILCSKNVYAKYFALCLGLSHLLSPLNQGLI